MKLLRILLVAAAAGLWAGALIAQPPVPHELLGHKESTFKIPRTRPFNWYNYKWMGGSPDLEEECGGCCHCFGRPAVWRCYEYIVPPDVPKLTVHAEYFELRRKEEDSQNILFNNVTDVPLFATDDMQFDYEPGYHVRGQFNLTHLAAFEAVFFTTQEMQNSDAIIDSISPIRLEAAGIVVVDTDPFQAKYETQIESGEVNFRRYFHHGAVSLTTGPRWFDMDDLMQIGVIDAADQLVVQTNNFLYGWQFGIEGQHWVDYGILRIDGSFKGGLYQNNAEQASSFGLALAAAEDQATTWIGELRTGIVLPITQHLFLRSGYHATYLSGVATAADQLNTTDLSVPSATVYTNGQVLYHGWFLGLEAWW